MKKVKNIFKYIIVVLLTVITILFLLLNLASNTILKETYITSKLKETNYYENTYKYVNEKFENYINQSGLDSGVLDGIVTEEKIKQDTDTIISNIYSGLNEEISTQEIKDNLNKNITNSLNGRNLTSTEQQSIETFVQTICDEYIQSISHTDFENAINNVYEKINKNLEIIQKVLLIFIGLCIIILLLLNIKRIYRFFSQFSISLLASGAFLAIINIFIISNIQVQNISILNDAFTILLTTILNEILQNIVRYSIVLIVVGICLTIISNLLHNIRKYKCVLWAKQERNVI